MKTMKNYAALIIAVLLFNSLSLYGQDGTLDADLNANGKVTSDFFGARDVGFASTVQQDGKIIVAGYTDENIGSVLKLAIARYHPDGTLDNSFGLNGLSSIFFVIGEDVVLQQDGKIVVVGYGSDVIFDFIVMRFNSDGSRDSTFLNNGIVSTDFGENEFAQSVAIQDDGKIVVAGYARDGINFDFAIARYNADGTLDNTFSFDGKVKADFGNTDDFGQSISIQSDGKIVVTGEARASSIIGDFAAVRFNTDGTLDNTFGTNGKVTTDIFQNSNDRGADAVIQPDGKIVLAGTSDNTVGTFFAVVRYNLDGTLDTTFSNDGKLRANIGGVGPDKGFAIALQPDGKILVAGESADDLSGDRDFALARFTSSGAFDTTFQSGSVTTNFNDSTDVARSVTIQPDGKILLSGFSHNGSNLDFALARYISELSVGVVNFSKELKSPLIYPNPILHTAQLEFELIKNEVIDIMLYDMSGKLVQYFLTKAQLTEGKHNIPLNFKSSITAGNYLLMIATDEGNQSIRIIIE